MIPLPFKRKVAQQPPPRRFQYDPNRKLQIIDVTDDAAEPAPLATVSITREPVPGTTGQPDTVRLHMTLDANVPREMLAMLLNGVVPDGQLENLTKKVG